jgi:predicted RNA binding protein YcfA (HicA-like mRNA interferase family)
MLTGQRVYKTRDFISMLNRNGFKRIRTTGDHGIFSDGERSIVITLGGKEINRMVARRLIKENCLI